MPTTPNRGWTYPSFEQNPYFDTIEDLFLAQDTDVHALMTARPVTVLSAQAGYVANAAGATPTTLFSFVLPASTLTTDGQMLRITGAGGFGSVAETKTLQFNAGGSNITLNALTSSPVGPKGWSFVAEYFVLSGGTTGYLYLVSLIGLAHEYHNITAEPSAPTIARTFQLVGTATTAGEVVAFKLTAELLL
jgi:hypothetical protein